MRDTADAGPHATGQSHGTADLLKAATPPAAYPSAPAAYPSASAAGSGASAGSTPRAASPAAAGATAAWPRQFAQVIVEILAGSRSPRQIVPLTTDRVRAQIGLLALSLASDQRPRIKRVVISRPTARAVEMTAIVSFGPRSRALAMRFEHMPARPAAPGLPARPARWLCTELEAG